MMRRLLLTLALCVLAACGAADDGSSQVPLGIDIHGLTADQIGHVQVVVLSRAKSFSCPDLRSTCLRGRVLKQDGSPIDDLVKLKDDQGVEHTAMLFAVDAAALTSAKGQTFEARMAPGSEYMVVSEVLSKDEPPTLLASGCSAILEKVGGGQNAAVGVQAFALAEPATCEAVIEK
ncbi:MAG TPA: hypothetical protein VGK67_38010 [Myxococcales bacterium]|jgi:hypothetical protein